MTKASPRKYMEAIRTLSYTKGRLRVNKVVREAHTSNLGAPLRSLGWVKGTQKVLHWSGPVPHTEEELLRMANILSAEVTRNNKKVMKNWMANRDSLKKHKAPKAPKAPEARTPASPTFRVSILWGLFTVSM